MSQCGLLEFSGVLHLCAICEVVLREVDLAKGALSNELVECIVADVPQLFRGELPENCVSMTGCVEVGLDSLKKLRVRVRKLVWWSATNPGRADLGCWRGKRLSNLGSL